MTRAEILNQFKTPWLTWGQCVEMCRLAGFTEYFWKNVHGEVPVNQPGKTRYKRYDRDRVAELLFPAR